MLLSAWKSTDDAENICIEVGIITNCKYIVMTILALYILGCVVVCKFCDLLNINGKTVQVALSEKRYSYNIMVITSLNHTVGVYRISHADFYFSCLEDL